LLLTEFDQLSDNAVIALPQRPDGIQLILSLEANIDSGSFITHLPNLIYTIIYLFSIVISNYLFSLNLIGVFLKREEPPEIRGALGVSRGVIP